MQFEDVSDSAFLIRHAVREETEKRRFAAYKAAVWIGNQTLEQRLEGPVPDPDSPGLPASASASSASLTRPPTPYSPRAFLPPPSPPTLTNPPP